MPEQPGAASGKLACNTNQPGVLRLTAGRSRAGRAIHTNPEWKVLLYGGKFTARSCHEPDLFQMPDFPFYALLAEYLVYILTIKKTVVFLNQKKSFVFQAGRVLLLSGAEHRRNSTNLSAQPARTWPAVNSLCWQWLQDRHWATSTLPWILVLLIPLPTDQK